ncbi:MAG: hypothetical protein HKN23_08865 [Verrucomicrobiales bacterium]|nr:hypothetical protein [Verrucomicrobiales bacterium]
MILVFLVLHIIGFSLSLKALNQTRTPQGTTAWVISLNTLPAIAVPAWLIFGADGIDSYVSTRRAGLENVRPIAEKLMENLDAAEAPSSAETQLEKSL